MVKGMPSNFTAKVFNSFVENVVEKTNQKPVAGEKQGA
jgi:hypothetical protein